jgi:hypothetical protein
MVERLTFEQIQNTVQRPKEVPVERWEIGMAVVEELMSKGSPANVLEDSVVGPNIPNRYDLTGLGVTVEHMPHWAYAIVDGESRSSVLFTAPVKSEDPNVPFARRALSKEAVIINLNTAIARAVPKRLIETT